MRTAITDALGSHPDITVVGQSSNGAEAVALAAELAPDVVTLDLIMPVMDGLAALQQLTRQQPAPAVLIVSGYTIQAADLAMECLAAGATDIMPKPEGPAAWSHATTRTELYQKVKAAAGTKSGSSQPPPPHPAATNTDLASLQLRTGYGALVIGSSTGGPVALESLLPKLPRGFPYPVVVAQHLPARFVESLARRLSAICQLPLEVGQPGGRIQAGAIYFCPGDADTRLQAGAGDYVRLAVQPAVGRLTPSVDALFESAASAFSQPVIGVVLTGMGTDGADGAAAIRAAGGRVIVQDEASSAVYGMGRAVVERDLASAVLPLEEIGQLLSQVHGRVT
jgi:two-component system chemotaxis response regulator CheB